MPLLFECPHCRAKYEVADDMAGKAILCRECEQRGNVPASTAKQTGAAAGPKPPTRRKALKLVAGSLAAGAVLYAGVYYWFHELPWEVPKPRRPPPGQAPDDQAGQPGNGQPGNGQPGNGQPGRRRGGGRGGGRRSQQPVQ
jgi:hypothetical protein